MEKPLDQLTAFADPEPDHLPHGELARATFRHMIRARIIENKLSSLYKAGKITGGVYLGKGQEAVSASVGACLNSETDIFAPLIRDQAGRTAFGEETIDCFRTYLGSVKGPMRGRDGNIHRGRPKQGMHAMISHLGTSISAVGGALMARRLQGKLQNGIGAACLGEGSTSTGAFHEGLNYIAVEKLPLVVVVTDNQFAYSTPNAKQYACKDLINRAIGYGVRGHSIDGTDFFNSLSVIHEAVSLARGGKGPQLVVAKLLRLSGHGEHDDASYIPAELRESHYGRDCIDVGSQQLLNANMATADEINAWIDEAKEEVRIATATAQQEPAPNPYDETWAALSSTHL